ncbi:hypothetical protein [Nocardia iowensis]|uniref:Secreted protein n=1 Tax=Nocardia iowensis TaxID=204891 RepID=A0ABX8RMQ6_NOCIO|nr:hypothetical protein [Nocardia iowensis]QXN90925.1 hypothetical protein KV110_37120 [Nocardia iowensis]
MQYRKSLLRNTIAVSALLGAVTVCAAPASAAPPSASFGVTYSLGDVCVGQLQSGISADGSGSARFGLSWVKATPTFGSPCGVTVFANWRNLDTGAAGTVPAPISDNTAWNQPPATIFVNVPTGPGRISVTVTTDRPHLAIAPIEIQVA